MLALADVESAATRLGGVANTTPVLTSRFLDDLSGAQIFLKCECFQRSGSFKFRGAYNALALLNEDQRRRGVVAASSGNHAQALALAASLLRIDATVVMPSDAPAQKIQATKSYGAKVVLFDRYKDDREKIQDEIAAKERRTAIPPYDNYSVMAGQGTVALELLLQTPNLDAFIAPVSGGGLIAGCATVLRAKSPQTRIFGAEPETADDTHQSLAAGQRINTGIGSTIADGLMAPTPGALTFPINQTLIDGVLVASDEETISAMKLLLERQKILIEPSGAVSLAAVIRSASIFQGQRVGVVLSGGNIDLPRLFTLFGMHMG